MLRATMKYSGVSAKVMALYGKLLTEDDWRHLCACASVSDIAAYLRSSKDWSEILPSSLSASTLQAAVLKKVFIEYERLYKFSYLEDKKYLLFTLYRAEYGFILDTMLRLQSNEPPATNAEATEFMRKHSLVDIGALESCTDYAGLLEAISGSIYEKPLKRLSQNQETGIPSYREAAVLFESQYYKTVFSYANKDYKGLGKKKLVKLLGTEADLLNIISLLRLHRYFPGSINKADELLIPIYDLLEPRLLKTLLTAKSEGEILEFLKKSRCRNYLEGKNLQKLESLYYEAMEAFCRKIIKSPEPSICVPVAYLTLRELECKKLARLIEAVDYGVEPEEVL